MERPAAFTLDEHRRETLLPRNHVSYRAVRAKRPVLVDVEDAPKAFKERLTRGFCAAVEAAWGDGCMGPDPQGKRLWASEVFIKVHDVAGSVIVDVVGEALLNEGWETADLRIRYGVQGDPPPGEDTETALGRAIGDAWVQALDGYTKELEATFRSRASEATSSSVVRWIAGPGYLREELWPLSYGESFLIGDRAWTFQRSERSGLRVGYLLDEKGAIARSETFDSPPKRQPRSAWTTRADPERRALLMALPMTAKDHAAVGDSAGKAPRFAVVALTRGGDARMIGRTQGDPRSAPLVLANGDALVLARRGTQVLACRFDSVRSTSSCPPLAGLPGEPERYQLLSWGAAQVAAVADSGVAYRVAWEGLTSKPWRPTAQPLAGLAASYTKPQEASKDDKTWRRRATISDGQLWLLWQRRTIHVFGASGERVRSIALNANARALAPRPGGGVVALGLKRSTILEADGAITAEPIGGLRAWVALPQTSKLRAIGCGPEGLIAFDGKHQVKRRLDLRGRCDNLAALPDGDILASRYLWVGRFAPPSAWPKAPKAQ